MSVIGPLLMSGGMLVTIGLLIASEIVGVTTAVCQGAAGCPWGKVGPNSKLTMPFAEKEKVRLVANPAGYEHECNQGFTPRGTGFPLDENPGRCLNPPRKLESDMKTIALLALTITIVPAATAGLNNASRSHGNDGATKYENSRQIQLAARRGGSRSERKKTADDYKRNFPYILQRAERGESWEQNELGWMYSNGLGVKQDYTTAITWFTKAAEQGNLSAQINLGWLYEKGLGVEQDYATAVSWYRKVAERGGKGGQSNLGRMYFEGFGVKKDYTAAFTWLTKAAERGDKAAAYNLGYMYELGTGVARNTETAVTWYTKAAEQEYAQAQYKLGFMYLYGIGVPQDCATALSWYARAAEQGHGEAREKVAELDCPKTE